MTVYLPDAAVSGGEKWRPVPGFERTYEVSSLGRIRSIPRPRTRGGIRKQYVTNAGYLAVILSQDGKTSNLSVHALVAAAFIGPRPEGMEVRHIDGDQLNLSASNLAYGTHSSNMLDKVRHGTHHEANKTHCPSGHPYNEANTYSIPSRPRARYCKPCHQEHRRARRERKRLAA
jgi:hypothetical protein